MADSLFDNRYRYDYIYPRGRSGETLRAVDTQANNRLVVIKRPAPNDAPPIRAGQEVSILNERKALTRLAGHPVLTELVGTGQFSVGGMPHQYIAIERGQGAIVADMVLELASHGQRLPELEMLMIIDLLLDLLHTAHAHDIVYNDVDAKHLFWNRDTYSLKLIDWGNAVFLEGDEITPQGISRQSDVAQVGELLYFILTGGRRPDIPRDAGEDLRLDFGDDSERIHSRLQSIVSRAVHPNLRIRYHTIAELRKALAEYRAPVVRDRDTILNRVTERLRRDRSRDELNGLMSMLEPALAMDPGYPQSREIYREILARQQDLEVSADLDAIRIYMESSNWSRTVNLLDELRHKAYGENARLINLLLDFAMILHDENLKPTPSAVLDSIMLIFEAHPERAAHKLLIQGVEDERVRALQWSLAERISAHVPEIHLLRPNLYRLDVALTQLATEGVPVTEPRAVLAEINATLRAMPSSSAASMAELRDSYRSVVDGLTALNTLLDAVSVGRSLPDRKLPFSTLERATIAAMALADNMHVIGKQAASSPRDATEALDHSRIIDPNNESWDIVRRLLDSLYELLGMYQTYVPTADGSDLESWLKESQADLSPFVARLFDEMLVGMVEGLAIAEQSWTAYENTTIQGNRMGAITALAQATDAVGTISPTLAGWFNNLRTIITNTQYVERHALYGGLGRALADGWEAFDRGRLADTEQLGKRATEIARTDPQRFAAGRLQRLAEITRNWVERNGVNDPKATKAALVAIERLFMVDENTLRENFTKQMPNKEIYLKAMSKGLIELYNRSSTAAVRILFMNYVLLGVLDAHEDAMGDADFWYEAAVKSLENFGLRHVAARALEEFIARRRDIAAGAELINQVVDSKALATLDSIGKQLEANPHAKILTAGIHSLRELQAALRDWSDGEFRPAGIKLENAINAVNEVEQAASITFTPYRAFLMELQAGSAELHTKARQMIQIIESRPEEAQEIIHTTHRRQYELTERLLGGVHAGTLRQWRDTYESFLAVYADTSARRSAKLTRFNELFRAMFIDRHPAYPLYRFWYDVTEQAPEFPAPPTSEPTPQITEIPDTEFQDAPISEPAPSSRRRIPLTAVLIGAGGILLIVVLILIGAASNRNGAAPVIAVTISDTPENEATPEPGTPQTVSQNLEITETTVSASPSATSDFITPTLLPLVADLTESPIPVLPTDSPTLTNTSTPTDRPTASPTPSDMPTRTPTSTPTLPPQGLQGRQDLLTLFNTRVTDYPWNSEQFSLGTDGTFWRLGVGGETGGDTITIAPPAEMLELYYGNNAASRITRVEATLTLTTFNPPLVIDNEVFFGLVFQDVNDPANIAGLQIRLVEPGVIGLDQRIGSTVQAIGQRTVNAAAGRVRLERDLSSGAVVVFFNDEQLGQPIQFNAGNVVPALFVKDGGVIVSVTNWLITLR
jgi:serine/threonine protein kinase